MDLSGGEIQVEKKSLMLIKLVTIAREGLRWCLEKLWFALDSDNCDLNIVRLEANIL